IRLDITDIKLAEQKLIQSSKMASLGEMAGGLAHEINNPLTVIHGLAAQLSKALEAGNAPKEKLTVQAEKVLQTVERIARIIKGLRTFSRNAEDDPMLLCDVRDIIDETLGL